MQDRSFTFEGRCFETKRGNESLYNFYVYTEFHPSFRDTQLHDLIVEIEDIHITVKEEIWSKCDMYSSTLIVKTKDVDKVREELVKLSFREL
jgi:hypothetical protein